MLTRIGRYTKAVLELAAFVCCAVALLLLVPAPEANAQRMRRVVEVQPAPTPKFIPPHVRGDRDFNGHGSVVNVRVELFVRNGQLWCYVHMNAKETRADWTEADGDSEYLIYSPPHGRVVALAHGQKQFSTLHYTDHNHADDVFTRGPSDPVKVYTASGDRCGDDAGVHTGVQLDFNRIKVVVE